jgi:outer membrane protein assembly factor BamB
VCVGSEDKNIYAVNAATGALLWRYATGGVVDYSSPAVSNGAVFIGSFDGNVYAFDLSSGDTEAAPIPPDPHALVPDLTLKVTKGR